jgi:hypothetical protein
MRQLVDNGAVKGRGGCVEESRAPYRPGASFNLCFTKVVEGSMGRERVRGLIKGRCFISAMSGDKRGRKKIQYEINSGIVIGC